MERVIAGRYEVGELIGRGGSSAVYRGYDRKLEQDVAVKHMYGVGEDEESRRARDHERRVHSALKSSMHVVRLLDQVDGEEGYYLILELMEHSLGVYREPVGVEEVVKWLEGCLEGLVEMHGCGVVHRDIKPSNVFLDRAGNVRVGDFGESSVGGSRSLRAWTPEYLAPEVIEGGKGGVGSGSDLYSLGYVGYRLLLGEEGMRSAFPEVYGKEGVTAEGVKHRWMLWHTSGERTAPRLRDVRSDVPEGMSEWLGRMVEKDVGKRCGSAEEALAGLRSLRGSEGRSDETGEKRTCMDSEEREGNAEDQAKATEKGQKAKRPGKSRGLRNRDLLIIWGALCIGIAGWGAWDLTILKSLLHPVPPNSMEAAFRAVRWTMLKGDASDTLKVGEFVFLGPEKGPTGWPRWDQDWNYDLELVAPYRIPEENLRLLTAALEAAFPEDSGVDPGAHGDVWGAHRVQLWPWDSFILLYRGYSYVSGDSLENPGRCVMGVTFWRKPS
ncbi:MAG: serine/threonine-protein kinase [Bacteroidota bacterium]